jgi:hypothetical protein
MGRNEAWICRACIAGSTGLLPLNPLALEPLDGVIGHVNTDRSASMVTVIALVSERF